MYAGCSLELQCFEIKTEADNSDITDYDDMSSTGMFVFIDGQFPCTAFAFMFHVSVVFPCTSQALVMRYRNPRLTLTLTLLNCMLAQIWTFCAI